MTFDEEPSPAIPDELADRAVERLLAIAPDRRAEVLDELVGTYPEHASALRRIHDDLRGAEQLLDDTFPELDEESPTSIGGHRVLRRLGEGAFGIVYLCAQEQPVARHVAIKVLRPGAGNRNTLRRFDAERQLLASLNHPAITHIFDAGRMPDGRPFFVMEHVDGVPIPHYCEEKRLSCDARLALFGELCRGVEHAHARGIVHRDLKPANVLIVEVDGVPQPKIIDFGIAKALHTTTGAERPVTLTDAGRVIGTPGYMSPEQASGQVRDVDARTDVFALGVILYELLTGELPWAQGAASADRTPDRPSARVASRTTRSAPAALPTPRPRAWELRGDLDWITLKALALERELRYQSVRELAADVERHRAGRPISARPPSARYRLSKYVRRNRSVIASLGAAVAVVVIMAIGAVSYARGADDEAARNFATATAAVDGLLARVNDDRLRNAPQSDHVRQVLLQDALEFYDRFLGERPTDPALREGRCDALLTLSEVHFQLGQLEGAERIADEALAGARTLHSLEPDDVRRRGLLAEGHRKKGRALAASGRVQAAEPHFLAAVEHLGLCRAEKPHEFDLSLSSALREVATCHGAAGRREECVEAHRRSVAVLEESLATSPRPEPVANDLVIALASLSQQLLFVGAPDEAEAVLARADEVLPRVTVDAERAEFMIASQRGRIAHGKRDYESAILQRRRSVDAASRWQRKEPFRRLSHESKWQSLCLLAESQDAAMAWEEATETYARAIECADEMLATFPEDPSRRLMLCSTLRSAGQALWDRFRLVDLEQAERWAARAVEEFDLLAPEIDARERGERWEFEARLALIRRSLGEAHPDEWENIANTLLADDARPDRPADELADAWLAIATSRLRRSPAADVAAALGRAREQIESGPPHVASRGVELGRLEAALAAREGDAESAARAADAILNARATWLGRHRAAEALTLAWRVAASREAPEAADYRERAVELHASVVDELADEVARAPDDPFYAVPWAVGGLRLAQLAHAQGDEEAARHRLDSVLPALERLVHLAHRDHLEQTVVEEARALAATARR